VATDFGRNLPSLDDEADDWYIGVGALYVIVEYCAHGCLRNYLVKNRSGFIDSLDSTSSGKPLVTGHQAVTNDYVNSLHDKPKSSSQAAAASCSVSSDSLCLTTSDLVCFAFQIARGMEYLASRNVSFVGSESMFQHGLQCIMHLYRGIIYSRLR